MAKVVFANEALSTVIDGARIRVARDEACFDTDAVVKAHPGKFSDIPAALRDREAADAARSARAKRAAEADSVEQATAAPGEKRAAKKTAAKKG